MKILKVSFLALILLLSSCSSAKSVLRTVDDIATDVCVLFGTEHPKEYETHVKSVLPPGRASEAMKDGLVPEALCKIKEVVQPFIDDQLKLNRATAAGLKRRQE